MKIVYITLFFNALSYVKPSTSDFIKINGPKIINGVQVTNRNEFAYQVSLTFEGNHVCGGILLNNWKILTAAHCLENNYDLKVELGHLDLRDENRIRRTIASKKLHEDFKTVTMDPNGQYTINDLAIIEVDTEIEFTDAIKPIDLATAKPADGTVCVVSGWGMVKDDPAGEANQFLMKANVPLMSQQECINIFTSIMKPNTTDGMLCAGYENGSQDFCRGDSGGPLVCNNALVGTVSWGACGQVGFPGVYMDVLYYADWIKTNDASSMTVHAFTLCILPLIRTINLFLQ